MCTRVKATIGAAAAVCFLAASGSAVGSTSIVAYWSPVAGVAGLPYPAPALANDPVLIDQETWDLRVVTSGDWISGGLRLTLPPGHTFYRHAVDFGRCSPRCNSRAT